MELVKVFRFASYRQYQRDCFVYCSVSIVAKKRFPTFEHLVEAGLLTKDELKAFESVEIQ